MPSDACTIKKFQEFLKSQGYNVTNSGTVDSATITAAKQYYIKYQQQMSSMPIAGNGNIIQAAVMFCRSAGNRTYSQCGQEIYTNGTVSNPRYSDCSTMVTASLVLAGLIRPRSGKVHQWATSNSNWQANPGETVQRNTGWPIIWKSPGWENYLAPGDVLWKSGHVQFFAGRAGGTLLTLNHGTDASIVNSSRGPQPLALNYLNTFTRAFRPNKPVIC